MSKPTRNRVMCPDCRRMKMLFETESKARNFIKFNGNEIETNGAELRIYYCPACCGYHISSKEYTPVFDKHTDNMINAFHRTQGPNLDELNVTILIGKIIQSFPSKASYTRNEVKKYINQYFVDYPDVILNNHDNEEVRKGIYKRFNLQK